MSRFLLLFFLFASILPSYANDPFGKGTQSFSLDQQPAFLPVEEAYQASIDVLDNSLLVDWRIAEGYYLYRERFEVVASRDGQAIAAESRQLAALILFEAGTEGFWAGMLQDDFC